MADGTPLTISSIETHLATYLVGRAGVTEIAFCPGSGAGTNSASTPGCAYHERSAYHVRTHGRIEVIPEGEVVRLWLEA